MSKLFLETSNEKISIYMSAPEGKSDKYMKYSLLNIKIPYTDGGTYQNQNLWRLYELYVYEKNGEDVLSQFLPYPIVNHGEWECALRIDGTPDFHGGFHGYEHLTNITAELDGKPFDVNSEKALWADSFMFCQESNIYRQGTENELMATHIKKYVFENGLLKLHQQIEWAQSVKVMYAYMAMLPIKRTSDDTPSGDIITEYAKTNLSSEVFDVKKEGHQTPVTLGGENFRNVSCAEIWSDKSGIKAQMKTGGLIQPDNSFNISPADCYNKFYYSYTGDGKGHITEIGEKWLFDSEYKIYCM